MNLKGPKHMKEPLKSICYVFSIPWVIDALFMALRFGLN
jgi:hypothetical protein